MITKNKTEPQPNNLRHDTRFVVHCLSLSTTHSRTTALLLIYRGCSQNMTHICRNQIKCDTKNLENRVLSSP